MFKFRIYLADNALNSTQAIANLAPPSLTTSLPPTTLMWLSGELPQTGDALTWENWRLGEVDLDGKRIDKILATPIPPAEASHPDAPAGPA